MTKKVFYLKNCDTCRKILKSFDLDAWQLREIKTEPITPDELSEIKKFAGNYESVFSKKSTQIKARNIDVTKLTDGEMGNLILEHYSFLKRPVFLFEYRILADSTKENIQELQKLLPPA